MSKIGNQLEKLKNDADNLFFIHYSCENLGDNNEGYSPRVTSIAVLHNGSMQMSSFSMHLIAEELGIQRVNIMEHYDSIEKVMLKRFFDFAKDRQELATWVHWNMNNVNFGFEALEHRYRVLNNEEPYHINEYKRINISRVVQSIYGKDCVPDPKMQKLMELNGGVQRSYLSGEQEVHAFRDKEFVKLHNSTICKVYFFQSVFNRVVSNRLKTNKNQLGYKIGQLYQSTVMQTISIIGIFGTLASLIYGLIQIVTTK